MTTTTQVVAVRSVTPILKELRSAMTPSDSRAVVHQLLEVPLHKQLCDSAKTVADTITGRGVKCSGDVALLKAFNSKLKRLTGLDINQMNPDQLIITGIIKRRVAWSWETSLREGVSYAELKKRGWGVMSRDVYLLIAAGEYDQF